MTEAEVILWLKIKGKQLNGYKFRRQHGIGNYIVDFYCPKLKLVIELDGEQHGEDHVVEYDNKRTEYLKSLNVKVLRYQNEDVFKDLDIVLDDIINKLDN